MGNGLGTQARRIVLQQTAPVYHQASGSQKQKILEKFVTATGYAHKYAQWLLHQEQKNGVVVRQIVDHGRLIGAHAYRQLDELYRAIHWYVNGF